MPEVSKQQVLRSRIFSPGIIGGEKAIFISCDKNFFFMKHNGAKNYLKDGDGKYVKVAMEQVIEARILYLSSPGYMEQEKAEAIQDELEKLGKELVVKANEFISLVKQQEAHLSGHYDDILTKAIIEQNGTKEKYRDKAVEFFRIVPTAVEIKQALSEAVSQKDYETLYRYLNRFEPLGSFKTSEGADITAFVNLFHASVVNNTIADLQEKGALYLKAKINVEKTYYPE